MKWISEINYEKISKTLDCSQYAKSIYNIHSVLFNDSILFIKNIQNGWIEEYEYVLFN